MEGSTGEENNGKDVDPNNGQGLPPNLVALSNDIGIDNVTCNGCQSFASCCEASVADGYQPGECFVFSCDACSARSWAYCRSCRKRFLHGNTKDHPKSKKHKQHSPQPEPAVAEEVLDGAPVFAAPDAAAVLADLQTTVTITTNAEDDYDENVIMAETTLSRVPIISVSEYPKLSIKGNEWMAAEFADTGRATLAEMTSVFEGEPAYIRDYWVAEHASPPGRCGGGLRYFVAKTFQNAENIQIDGSRVPKFAEARVQFESFIQYQSMSELQRQRQSRIDKAKGQWSGPGNIFEHTHIPPYKDLSRLYGRTGKLSMWNTLPIPQPQNVLGVSYVGPEHILKFAFANGVPVDDIVVHAGAPAPGIDAETRVYHVSECHKLTQWLADLATDLADLATSSTQKFVVVWIVDWKDGFGPSRVKNNRGSVDAWTFTLSCPKHLINATDNTFLMALGPKNAHKGWQATGHMFRKEMEELTSNGPLMVYSGAIQKVIPVYVKRMVALTDRVERPDSTSTIAHSSDMHRCFGVAGKIETPSCKVEEVKQFLVAEQLGQSNGNFGWCDDCIEGEDRNGKAFAACKVCRKKRLQRMGVIPIRKNTTAEKPDCTCADWVQWQPSGEQKKSIKFPASKEYPTFTNDGCPIEPPKGREIGLQDLCQLRLTWELMIRACRFAFYNCSRPKKRGFRNWTMTTCFEYGRTCGISSKIMRLLFNAAKEAKSHSTDIDYASTDSIGDFTIPWAWLSDISVGDYIETIMHLMHLGITESNLELATKWLKVTKTTGMDSTKFRREVNELLEELKKLQLAWLLVFPFTGTEFKTGAWVSENWLAFARISPILFGWLIPPPGNEDCAPDYFDLARVILSYHCVAARVHTHAGIDQAFVDETENYMKEFLSCVRELDVRVRHHKLNTAKSDKRGETKLREAFWLKSNYMSLLNLLNMMVELGPLVLWWDGGGKGERFIQEIKPHILRGIRADIDRFWVNLHTKIFKVRQMKYMEQRYSSCEEPIDECDDDCLVSLIEATLEWEDDKSDDDIDVDNASVEYASLDSSDEDSVEEVSKPHLNFSHVEEEGMHKVKTIHIYRNLRLLEDTIEQGKPIAGCVQMEEGKLVFYTVHRVPVKSFARRKLEFLDHDGIHHHGMWYCEVNPHAEDVQRTDSFVDIQNDAKMAAVAIPLRYIIRLDKNGVLPEELTNKYCVITNYWKVRSNTGAYDLPCLDKSLYNFKRNNNTTGASGVL